LYMTKINALNLLVNSDLRISKSLAVKHTIKCEFRRFFVILTSKEMRSHKLDYTSLGTQMVTRLHISDVQIICSLFIVLALPLCGCAA
jgi:hypothetical protein